MPQFKHELYVAAPGDISFSDDAAGGCSLHALAKWFTLTARSWNTKWLLKSFGVTMAIGVDWVDCQGTRQQLTDYCLLRLRVRPTNEVYSAHTRTILERITGAPREKPYAELLAERLRGGGFADETDWIVC